MRPAMVMAVTLMAGTALGSDTEAARTRNVAVVVYEGVEILDFAGPAEVFAAAGDHAGLVDRRAFRPYTVGVSKDPVLSQGFVRITPEFSVDDAPKPALPPYVW